MSLLQRVRNSGLCPPKLLGEERNVGDVGFDATISRVLDLRMPDSLSLRNDDSVATDMANLVQMASSVDKIPGDGDTTSKLASLEQRRCILLAIMGSTAPDNVGLKRSLERGLLTAVRLWLDEILSGKVGGVDLLLFLLSSISGLPVTRTMVKDSGLGKKIGSIEKHKISAGTLNESAIAARVESVKDKWNKSVKANQGKASPETRKRLSSMNQPLSKRQKTEEPKRSKFSSLLRKVSTPKTKSAPISKPPVSLAASSAGKTTGLSVAKAPPVETTRVPLQSKGRKPAKRVKWADHFGGMLEKAKEIEAAGMDEENGGRVSWTDRKKRDRMREKELLAKMKKSKLVDDDDDIFSSNSMKATTSWHQPIGLQDRPEITKPQLESKEIIAQGTRMMKVAPARYLSNDDVPRSPAPMSDVEQALDMTRQASAVPVKIPFFAPQQAAPEPAPAPPPPSQQPSGQFRGNAIPPPPGAVVGATAEMVQAMGLPMFLVGSNVQALQTLAASPSLLSTFVDASGMYDQQRLMTLVQSLTQNINPSAPPPPNPSPYGSSSSYGQQPSPYAPPPQPSFGAPAPPSMPSTYGQSSFGARSSGASSMTAPGSSRTNGYRGDQNTSANLHLTGYGPMATQAEILSLFSPYVRVDEVVMKTGFCFVNTSDPVGARQAKEALNGTLIGGMPVKISMAQRRNRDPNMGGNGGNGNSNSNASSSMAAIYGGGGSGSSSGGGGGGGGGGSSTGRPPSSTYGSGMGAPNPPFAAPSSIPFGAPPPPPSAPSSYSAPPPAPAAQQPSALSLPRNVVGGVDYDNVRDDRGNPATKNLFVAGYGPGTSEQQLREIFGQHAPITGCVMKGNFTFVNTADRISAVNAREALTGTLINGGVLRINFAKESGRLGTSFDLTYGPNTHKGINKSYYGR